MRWPGDVTNDAAGDVIAQPVDCRRYVPIHIRVVGVTLDLQPTAADRRRAVKRYTLHSSIDKSSSIAGSRVVSYGLQLGRRRSFSDTAGGGCMFTSFCVDCRLGHAL